MLYLLICIKTHNSTLGQPPWKRLPALDWADPSIPRLRRGKWLRHGGDVCGLLCWWWTLFLYYSYCRNPTGREFFVPAGTLSVKLLRCIRKSLQEKGESHEVLSPFEHRTSVIFQVLILTLDAFQTSCGINLWIWIGESVFQTMQSQLFNWWGNACFFHSKHVDQTLCLSL